MSFHQSIIVRSCGGLKSQDLAHFCEKFAFLWKNDPLQKIFKILFWKYSSPHQSTCSVQISSNLADRNGKVMRYLPHKKISPCSHALASAWIAPKICQGQPQTMYSEYSRFHPNRFTFGGVISECVNTIRVHSKVNAIFSWSLASSRIIILPHNCCIVKCLLLFYPIMHSLCPKSFLVKESQ